MSYPIAKNLWMVHPAYSYAAANSELALLAQTAKVAIYDLAPPPGGSASAQMKLRVTRNYDPLTGGLGASQLKVHTVQILAPTVDAEGVSTGNISLEITVKYPPGSPLAAGSRMLANLRALACAQDTHPVLNFLAGNPMPVESYDLVAADTNPAV